MQLGFCVFHYLLRILPSFLPFYLFPFLSPSFPLLPSLLSVLSPSPLPPFFFPSFSFDTVVLELLGLKKRLPFDAFSLA